MDSILSATINIYALYIYFFVAEDLSNLLSSIPTLQNVMNEVDQVANSGGRYADAPHVIEVILPMLCRYNIPLHIQS